MTANNEKIPALITDEEILALLESKGFTDAQVEQSSESSIYLGKWRTDGRQVLIVTTTTKVTWEPTS